MVVSSVNENEAVILDIVEDELIILFEAQTELLFVC